MLGNETVVTHISKPAQFETGKPDLGPTLNGFKLYYCNKYADMTLEPERDNPNDIRTKLAQHEQVSHKMAALSSDWLAPYAHRTQNRIFCVESSSSEETPNTPLIPC